MVQLALVDPSAGAVKEVRAEAIVLRGAQIERQPEAEPVAFAAPGGWEIDRDRFVRIECRQAVICLFEEDGSIGERRGPLQGLSVQDGTVRSGETIVAVLRGTYWQSASTLRAWPRIRVVDVPAPGPVP